MAIPCFDMEDFYVRDDSVSPLSNTLCSCKGIEQSSFYFGCFISFDFLTLPYYCYSLLLTVLVSFLVSISFVCKTI